LTSAFKKKAILNEVKDLQQALHPFYFNLLCSNRNVLATSSIDGKSP